MPYVTFTIESRDHNRKWKRGRFSRAHPTLDAAIAAVRSYDEDGLFSANYRIKNEAGQVVMTAEQYRSAS